MYLDGDNGTGGRVATRQRQISAGKGYGRFLQADPLGYEDGMNMYDYVGGDPVNNVDPSGKRAASPREANWINKMYGGVLDKDATSTLFIQGNATGGYNHVGPGYDIYFIETTYRNDFLLAPPQSYERKTFYHETWHLFEMRAGIVSFSGLLLNQALSAITGNDPYVIKEGVPFTQQNPEARATIFANSVASNNFSSMNGFSHTFRVTTH